MKIRFEFRSGDMLDLDFSPTRDGLGEDDILASVRGEELIGVEVHGKRARIVEEDEVLRFRLVERRKEQRRVAREVPRHKGRRFNGDRRRA